MRQRLAAAGVGLGVTALMLYLALRGIDIDDLSATIRSADWRWAALLGVSSVLADCVRAVRWGYILPGRRIALGPRVRAVMIGAAANQVLPFRLGEAARAVALARPVGISTASTMTTLVVERFLDVVGMLFVLAGCMLVVPSARNMSAVERGVVSGLTAAVVVAALVLVCVVANRQKVSRWLQRRLAALGATRFARLAALLGALAAGLGNLGNGRQVLMMLLLTVAVWTVFGSSFAFGLLSLDISSGDPSALLPRAAFVLVSVALFTMMPAAVGTIGTFQAGCIVALAAFGVTKEEALGYAIVVHAVQFSVAILTGGIALAGGGVFTRAAAGSGVVGGCAGEPASIEPGQRGERTQPEAEQRGDHL